MAKWYICLYDKYKKIYKTKTKQRTFSTIGKKQIFHIKKQYEFFDDKPQQSFVCHAIQYIYENTD